MTTRLKIAISVVLGLSATILAGLGYVRNLERNWDAIANAPGARIEVTPFVPLSVGRTRTLDLGYARMSVPETFDGELVRLETSDFLGLGVAEAFPIMFCPPKSNSGKGMEEFFKSVAVLSDVPINTWFELEKAAVSQRPSSIWKLAASSRQKAAFEAALLSIKSVQCATASSVRLYESSQVGLIVWSDAHQMRALVADLKSGLSQEIFIQNSVTNPDELISAIAENFEIPKSDSDTAYVERAIAATNLRVVSPNHPGDPPPSRGGSSGTKERRLQ